MALVRPMALCLCKARTHALTHMQRRTNSVRCLQRAAILDCCHPGPGDVGARRVELRVHFTVSRRRRASVLATAVPGACLGSVLRREGQREGRGPDARAPGARNPRSPSVRRGAAAPVCSCPSPWPPGAGAHVTVARAAVCARCCVQCGARANPAPMRTTDADGTWSSPAMASAQASPASSGSALWRMPGQSREAARHVP